jgi:predicted nicotinamide N-methyase
VKSKSVLELGAGTGFVGIAAAFLSPIKIILTDLEYTVKLINDNISLNKGAISHNQEKRHDNNEDNNDNQKIIQCNCECQVCDWFDPPPIKVFGFMSIYPEIILIADCVWVEELVDPLMNTLEGYCNDETTVVITYQQRGKVAHERFWNRLRNMFDVIDSVDTETMCGLKKPNKISLIECSGFIRVQNMGLGLDKE